MFNLIKKLLHLLEQSPPVKQAYSTCELAEFIFIS